MKMDCKKVREIMFLFNDNELDEELLAPFRRHLEDCPPCARQLTYLTRLLTLVRERCGRYSAPSRLRVRILASFPHRQGRSEEELES